MAETWTIIMGRAQGETYSIANSKVAAAVATASIAQIHERGSLWIFVISKSTSINRWMFESIRCCAMMVIRRNSWGWRVENDSNSVGFDVVQRRIQHNTTQGECIIYILYLHIFPKMKLCKHIVWLMFHVEKLCMVYLYTGTVLSNWSLKCNANSVNQ